MPNQPFEASIREREGAAVIDMRGDIDAFADQTLAELSTTTVSSGVKTILLNFMDVGYINSTGIALIVRLLALAQKNGIKILTYGLNSHYMEIFEITRLADFMTIFPDEVSAFAWLEPA